MNRQETDQQFLKYMAEFKELDWNTIGSKIQMEEDNERNAPQQHGLKPKPIRFASDFDLLHIVLCIVNVFCES